MAVAAPLPGSAIPSWVRATPDEVEAYEERAAIAEFEGKQPRKAAEKLALERLLVARRKV